MRFRLVAKSSTLDDLARLNEWR